MGPAHVLAALMRRSYNQAVALMDGLLLEGNMDVLDESSKAYLHGFLTAVEVAEKTVGIVWNGTDYEIAP
jgi:hypothetical protein